MKNLTEKFNHITKDLQKMATEDQAMRNHHHNNPDEWDDTVDHRNTKRMKEIIAEIGWPSVSKVGYEGSDNAWLLVQHADHDLMFQIKCLALMKAEPENEVSRRNIAFLEDRIAISEGRQQIYGTQFHHNADGQLVPLAITDPENVDLRRKAMWLDTLSEYKKIMNKKEG